MALIVTVIVIISVNRCNWKCLLFSVGSKNMDNIGCLETTTLDYRHNTCSHIARCGKFDLLCWGHFEIYGLAF